MTDFNPLNYNTALTIPDRDAISAWSCHVPFAMFIVELLRPRRIVELGTYNGVSYCAFCQSVEQLQLTTSCYAVDTWRGDEQGGYFGDEVLTELREYHDQRYAHFSRLVQSTFDEALEKFEDSSIDLLHIDGYHTYEAAQHDFSCWLPRLSDQGVVLFHDINVRERDFGVWRLWGELKTQYPHLELLHEHGLGVLAVGKHIPEGLQRLLRLTAEDWRRAQEWFYQRGLAMRREVDLRMLQQQIDVLRTTQAAELTTLRTSSDSERQLLEQQHTAGMTALQHQHAAELAALQARLETENSTLQHLHAAELTTVQTRLEAEKTTQQHQYNSEIAALQTRLEAENAVLQHQHAAQLSMLQAQLKQEAAAEQQALSEQLSEQLRLKQDQWKARFKRLRQQYKDQLNEVASRVDETLSGAATQHTTALGEVQEHAASERQQLIAQVETLQAELRQLRNTRGWRLLERWWHIRHLLTISPSRRLRTRQLASTSMLIARREGPVALVNRMRLWLRGERRYHRPAPVAAEPPQPVVEMLVETAPAPVPVAPEALPTTAAASEPAPVAAPLRQQHLPTNNDFSGISVIIPVHNALDYARACVDSLYSVRVDVPIEVIVVDNGSEPDVLAWLNESADRYPNFYFHHFPQNTGFSKGMNTGVRIARGNYLVLLNSDTLVTDGWVDRLVEAANADATLGILSPKTNYVGEGQQIEEAARHLLPEQANQYAASIRERSGIIEVPERMAFFCVMCSRALWELLGGLDEGFGLGNFEDEDFCTRTKMLGLKLAVIPSSFVYHHGSKTFTTNRIDHMQWMERNALLYLNKLSRLAETDSPSISHALPRAIDVSVIMRTRNRSDTLRIALQSLANQTFHNFEVVLINDGGEPIDEVLSQFDGQLKINYIHFANSRGKGVGMNTGYEAARGRYLCHLDDDDLLFPFHLELLQHSLRDQEHEFRLVYADYNRVLIKQRGSAMIQLSRVRVPTWLFDARALLVQNRLTNNSYLFSRDLLDKTGGFSEDFKVLDDWEFLTRLVQHTPFYPVKRTTCEYRLYNTLTNSINGRQRAAAEMQRIYQQNPTSDPEIIRLREHELIGINQQVAEIARMQQQVDEGLLPVDEFNRQVLYMVLGFRQ
ncbi:MAG: glycosyltransferase [Anaerolineae bacterium]